MKTNKLSAVLEGGATKYVKGIGVCVKLTLTLKPDETILNLLRRSTGGMVMLELEEAQEELFQEIEEEPNPFKRGKIAE
jgi:hypothetical protein